MSADTARGPRRLSPLPALRATVETVWANPVVLRDLRSQMRGTRSYWQLAAFLLVLSLISITGYGQAARIETGIVRMQSQLQELYYVIFMSLAAMVALIAPALTASSITGEKQRGTLDLLVTTPLSSAQLLAGKLISSTAFLLLLLSLSLPASALCVMLGGATIGDVFRTYVLLAIDGLLLAAIGLYYSCAAGTTYLALLWTYGSVFFISISTASLSGMAFAGGRMSGPADPLAALAALNPFAAVLLAPRYMLVGSVEVPVWLGAAIVALAIIRLLSAASALRLRFYGEDSIGPLRRQTLVLSALAMFGVAYSVSGSISATTGGYAFGGVFYMMTVPFLLASVLMPSLFVPAIAEDAPAGTTVSGAYRPRKAFGGEHSGSLPYFHLWLVVLTASIVAGIFLHGTGGGRSPATMAKTVLYTLPVLFYISGLGFLFWSVARRVATMTVGISGARALTYGTMATLAALPMMAMALTDGPWSAQGIGFFWILSPLLADFSDMNDALTRILGTGAALYVTGVLVYPIMADVEPGRFIRRQEQTK